MDNRANLDALFQSFERLSVHLEHRILEHRIENKDETQAAAELLLPEFALWGQLGKKFQLSTFEQLILLLGVALELEPNFQVLCARAQGSDLKPHVTLGFALAMLPGAHWSVLSPQCPLHYWNLMRTESHPRLTEAPLALDRRIFCYLLGQPALDEHLSDRVVPIPVVTDADLPPSHTAIAQQMVALWSSGLETTTPIALCGAGATIAQTICTQVCDRLGLQMMALSTPLLPTAPHELKQFQRHWEREAILSNSVLLLEGDASPEPGHRTAITLFLETLTTPVIFISRDRPPQLRRGIVTLDIPALTHPEQLSLWQHHLGKVAKNVNDELPGLASQFQLTSKTIQTVCAQFKIQNPKSKTQSSLWTLCRAQARPQLDDLAQRITPAATWDDLILPSRPKQVLKDIATHLQYRPQVYQDWGFAQKGDRGLGISALFYGDSGTGKTMAAEVLAQNCQLDLYRIDLSTVVSKYIGETEKNLRKIFDAAEAGGAILLFDEADALFGKRTDVKDSHDRHANIEVSYLLQRMESYQGLAILTSNLKNNLDDAFLRRLRFMVPFPFPEAQARANIWRGIFPRQTPTQGLDFDRLGQLKISGGNIRNIALNAAFIAAQANRPITMSHVRQATQRDYLKLEKLLTQEETKGWEDKV